MPKNISLAWCLVALVIVTLSTCHRALATVGDATPLVILYTNNDSPWTGWHGNRSPDFVLYGDGSVIYSTRSSSDVRFAVVTLTPSEMREFLARLDIPVLAQADGQRYGCKCDDAVTTQLKVRRPGGGLTSTCIGDCELPHHDDNFDAALFAKVKLAVERCHQFRHARASKWVPADYELRIRDVGLAETDIPNWPTDLPPLNFVAPEPGTTQSMRMAADWFPNIRLLLGPAEGVGPRVTGYRQYGGRKLRILYRPIFPHEDDWR